MTTLGVMLDTNIVSDLIHRPHGPARQRLDSHDPTQVCVSIFTASELRYGSLKRGSARLTTEIDAVLAAVTIVPFEAPADQQYALIRDNLTKAGKPIGPVDFFIAAHALALDLTLVTANIGEFSRVPNLRVENWFD